MTPPDVRLIVSFLDIGQGDCVLFRLPGARSAVVVDCPEYGSRVAQAQLGTWGVDHVTLAIFSHSDYDHAGGMVDIIHNLADRCDAFVFSEDRLWQGAEPAFKHRLLRQELAELMNGGIPRIQPTVVTPLIADGVTFQVIHPSDADRMGLPAANYRNEASLIIRAEYLGVSILLGGDVGGLGWQRIKDRGIDIRANVLKVSHHGAWHDDGLPIEQIASLIKPDTIIFSVGTKNPHGHPDARVVASFIVAVPDVRIMCTEVTARCDAEPQGRAEEVAARLGSPLRLVGQPGSCPCAGSIIVEVDDTGLRIEPDLVRHNKVIDLFDHPLCRAQRTSDDSLV